MKASRFPKLAVAICALLCALVLTSCGSENSNSASSSEDTLPELVISGIPDQETCRLDERFNAFAQYLADSYLGRNLRVRYQPVTDYAEIVSMFISGEIQLGWFGALAGVQARHEVPDAQAIAEREDDDKFRSVFIVRANLPATTLLDLAGSRFTFGSELSASGRLMPEYFLGLEGIENPEMFFSEVGYSGSHDRTWQLVQDGEYEAGALSKIVWDRAVAAGSVDLEAVRVLTITTTYHNYHWLAHPSINGNYGDEAIERLQEIIVDLDGSYESSIQGICEEGSEVDILENFKTSGFKPTKNSDYNNISNIAEKLNLWQR